MIYLVSLGHFQFTFYLFFFYFFIKVPVESLSGSTLYNQQRVLFALSDLLFFSRCDLSCKPGTFSVNILFVCFLFFH